MSAGRLSVGSLAVRARVPRDQPPVPGLAGDLRELVPRLVVPRVAALLDRALPADDPAVWLIRELRVELAVGARWDADRIAAHIAAAIGDGIERALRGDGGVGVTRVDDRAAHLAAVLADTAASTGRRWYHGAYAAAANGPRGTALAALLEDAGPDGPRALGATGTATALRIVRALPPAAAARLARAWSLTAGVPAATPPEPLRRAAAAAAALVPPDLEADAPRAAVLAFALASRAEPHRAPAALAAAVRAELTRRRTTAEHAAQTPPQPKPASANAAETAGERATAGPRASAETQATAAAPRVSQPRAASWTTVTEHGALFLWWRTAIESGASALATEATHGTDGHATYDADADGLALDADSGGPACSADTMADARDADRSVRATAIAIAPVSAALALARALTGSGAEMRFDPAVCALLRLDDLAEPDGIERVPEIRLADVLDRALAAASTAWPPLRLTTLILEAVPGATEAIPGAYVLADGATGRWLWVWAGEPARGDVAGMIEVLAGRFSAGPLPVLAEAGVARRLLPDRAVVALADGRVWTVSGDGAEVTGDEAGVAGDGGAVPDVPAAGRAPGFLAREHAALSVGGAGCEAGLAWAFLAQLAVRDLARRVPGFAHASTSWLRANVLPGAATVRFAESGGEGMLEAEIEPPPLAMLLRIAGQVPVRYPLPGSPPRTVAVALAGR